MLNKIKDFNLYDWFHSENQQIYKNAFEYKDKESPLNYVTKLSTDMIVSHIFNYLCMLLCVIF